MINSEQFPWWKSSLDRQRLIILTSTCTRWYITYMHECVSDHTRSICLWINNADLKISFCEFFTSKRCFGGSFHHQVVPAVKINDAKHFRLKNYRYKYIYRLIFGPSQEIEEISLFTTRWCRVWKLITPKYSPPKVILKSILVDYYLFPVLF